MKAPNRSNMVFAVAGFLAAAVLAAALGPHLGSRRNYLEIMAVTRATPLALKEEIGAGLNLEVGGDTERTYRFGRRALDAFATVHLRTREVAPDGSFEGTYRYTGIPALHILEGVAPKKREGAPFDRPLDMIVTFVSSSGDRRHFSYGELTMTDDRDPVLLAYARSPLLPSKLTADQDYPFNKHSGPLDGLRLVCPADQDSRRYLDDVVRIVLTEPRVDAAGLPPLAPGERCVATAIQVVQDGTAGELSVEGVERTSVESWVRTGHGRGFKGISSASGLQLRSLLRRNFADAGRERFFLFVACDGYRALFSGHEIFVTEAGERMMIIESIDGEPPAQGPCLGPVRDYFVDRMVRGLTHIVLIEHAD